MGDLIYIPAFRGPTQRPCTCVSECLLLSFISKIDIIFPWLILTTKKVFVVVVFNKGPMTLFPFYFFMDRLIYMHHLTMTKHRIYLTIFTFKGEILNYRSLPCCELVCTWLTKITATFPLWCSIVSAVGSSQSHPSMSQLKSAECLKPKVESLFTI